MLGHEIKGILKIRSADLLWEETFFTFTDWYVTVALDINVLKRNQIYISEKKQTMMETKIGSAIQYFCTEVK